MDDVTMRQSAGLAPPPIGGTAPSDPCTIGIFGHAANSRDRPRINRRNRLEVTPLVGILGGVLMMARMMNSGVSGIGPRRVRSASWPRFRFVVTETPFLGSGHESAQRRAKCLDLAVGVPFVDDSRFNPTTHGGDLGSVAMYRYL